MNITTVYLWMPRNDESEPIASLFIGSSLDILGEPDLQVLSMEAVGKGVLIHTNDPTKSFAIGERRIFGIGMNATVEAS